MTVLVIEEGCLSYGARKLFDNVRLRLSEHERVGLVGPNGSGKTTLLRVLARQQQLDSGRLTTSKYCKIGYLPQELSDLEGADVLTCVLSVVPGRSDIETRLTEIEHWLADKDTPESMQMDLVDRLSDLHEELDYYETWYSERLAREILAGLGFSAADLARTPGEFSGGWKMRIALARLLFQAPDVLLLDEPTNHLDVPSVTWLDEFLLSYRRAIVLICHDRVFLNRHVNKIWSFEPEGLRQYTGNYDQYLTQRAEEEEVLDAQAKNQEQKIRELTRFVDRVRARASKARQAQSRTKVIEKLEKELVKPIVRPMKLSFRFGDIPRCGRDVVRLEQVHKSFGTHTVLRSISKTVHSRDRIVVIGRNGTGKTTLLKILAGELLPDGGQVHWGAGVERGYYAQHHTELLSTQRTVLEEVWSVVPTANQTHVRSICGAFLFSGDEVDKPISVLSGGERARVLLARLLVKPGNLLLMDEPTNHLDIGAAEALADALADYQGTVILVSHNLGFVNRLATQIWDLSDGGFVVYPGTLPEYLSSISHQPKATTTEIPAFSGDAPPIASEEPSIGRSEISYRAPSVRGHASTLAAMPGEKGGPTPQKRASNVAPAAETNTPKPPLISEKRPANTPPKPKKQPQQQKPRSPNPDENRSIKRRVAQLETELAPLAKRLADPETYADTKAFSVLLKEHETIRHKIAELRARLR